MMEVFRTHHPEEVAVVKSILGGAKISHVVVPENSALVVGSLSSEPRETSIFVDEDDLEISRALLVDAGFITNIDLPLVDTTLLNGRVALLQPKVGFHASIDTVFLAAAVPLKDKMQLLDVGCGVGSAGLCVLARTRHAHLTGIDTQGDLIAIARRNAALNDVEGLARFVEGNILDETTLPDGAFGVVMMNPPYQDGGTVSPEKIKAMSHEEAGSGASLLDWIKYGHRKLISGGTLVLIHRADRMDEIISTLVVRRWFGSLTVQPLLSRVGDDAKRVIILARKERYRGMILKPGFVIHEADGKYTAEAQAILSEAKPLFPTE